MRSKIRNAKGIRANIKSSHNDSRFNEFGLTAVSSKVIMAMVLFNTDELTFEQRMAHNICNQHEKDKYVNKNSGALEKYSHMACCIPLEIK